MLSNLLSLILLLVLETTVAAVLKTAFPEHGWKRRWLAPRDGRIKLHIALKQADGGWESQSQLLAVSDPGSPWYRRHLGADQAAYLSTPAIGSADAVESWLWKHGVLSDAELFNGMFEVDLSVRQAERLLNTTYFIWSDGTRDIVRTERFYVPDDMDNHLDFVAPTTVFPRRTRPPRQDLLGRGVSTSEKAGQVKALNDQAGCGVNSFVTPTCVRQVYDINYSAQPNRTTFAIYGTEAASFSSGDLQTYLERYNSPAADAEASYTVIGNGDSSEKSGVESKFETALDTQTALGLAWPAEGVLYNNGGVFGPDAGQTYDPFVSFLQKLVTNRTVPSVVSFSESMPEDQIDAAYATRLCNMMAQVGARGVTLLFSSGDNGPNGDQPSGDHKAPFEPEFPASCPWVTAVGGTTNLADETAATKSTISIVGRLGYTASGGGFSNLFGLPGYQATAVDNYTSKYVPASYQTIPGYNPPGRGIPDVSAFSTNFPTVVDFVTFPVGGTSASTPLWAAIVAVLNDYEASKGRPALGFLNPFLYGLSSGLKDITTGGNNAGSCNILEGCNLAQTPGYNVTVGWDPVTGLGSPIFSELTKALDALDVRTIHSSR